MVEISRLNKVSSSDLLNSVPFDWNFYDNDKSIFEIPSFNSGKVEALQNKLNDTEDKNGVILSAWNSFKEITGVGTSLEKCTDAIEKYEKGEFSFEEASEIIDNYNKKQGDSLNLFTNIASSTAAIAAVTIGTVATAATGGLVIPALLIGALSGAVAKSGLKTVDRATNDVKGDALDSKQILKDSLSGALTGGMAVATMGNGKACETLGKSVINGAKRSSLIGLKTGAISGASNYMIDTAFDDEKEFSAADLVSNTVANAVLSGTVGGIMGSMNGALKYSGVLKSGGKVELTSDGTLLNATKNDATANAICSAEYKIVNDRLRAAA